MTLRKVHEHYLNTGIIAFLCLLVQITTMKIWICHPSSYNSNANMNKYIQIGEYRREALVKHEQIGLYIPS
jgi:hypothetical protein